MTQPARMVSAPNVVDFKQWRHIRREKGYAQAHEDMRIARIEAMYKALSDSKYADVMDRLPREFALGLRDFIVTEVYLWLYEYMQPAPHTQVLSEEWHYTLEKRVTDVYHNLDLEFWYVVNSHALVEAQYILRQQGIKFTFEKFGISYAQIKRIDR